MPTIVINDLTPRDQYTANGVDATFNFNFQAFYNTDLQVFKRPAGSTANDPADLLILGMDYSVTFNTPTSLPSSGFITLNVVPLVGDIITIARNQPDSRNNYYINGGSFDATIVNADFDSDILMIQQNKMYDQVLGLHYNVNDVIDYPFVDNVLPVLPPNNVWMKNSTDDEIIAVPFTGGGGGGSGQNLIVTINQPLHGFTADQVVFFNGVQWALARADTAADAEVIGMVADVTNPNTFTLLISGLITTTALVLVPGSVYFVSDVIAGLLTTVEPNNPGSISKPVLIATDTNSGYFINFRGKVIPAFNSNNLTYVTNTDETLFLPNSQPLSLLATGIAKVTNGSGLISTLPLPLQPVNGGLGISNNSASVATLQTVYVAPTGSDVTGNGSSLFPYATYDFARTTLTATASATNVYVIIVVGIINIVGDLTLSPFIGIAGVDNQVSQINLTGEVKLDASFGTKTNPFTHIKNIILDAASNINLTFPAYQNSTIHFDNVSFGTTAQINVVGSGTNITPELVLFENCLSIATQPAFSFTNVQAAIVNCNMMGVTSINNSLVVNNFLILANIVGATGNVTFQTTSTGTQLGLIQSSSLAGGVFTIDGILSSVEIDASSYQIAPTLINGATLAQILLLSLSDGIDANTNFTPVNYAPTGAATYKVNSVTANLHGIDLAIGSFAGGGNGAQLYSVDTGVVNAYVVTLAPIPAAYVAGLIVNFKTANTNTSFSTIDVNGLGVKNIAINGSTSLRGGEITAGQVVSLIYDGVQFEIVSNIPALPLQAQAFGVDSGAADAYVITLDPAPKNLYDGILISFIPTHNNTGAVCSVTVNGLGPFPLETLESNPPQAGFIKNGVVTFIYFDSGLWRFLSEPVYNDGTQVYGVDVGVADAYDVNIFPNFVFIPTDGTTINFKAIHNNTGASTLTVNGATHALVNFQGAALVAGDILAGNIYSVIYNQAATKFQLVSPTPQPISGIVPLANGGTNANLTANNGGIVWSNATQLQILAGTATANKMLLSGSTATPAWSTSTIPSSAGAAAGKVLVSDGTNYVLSTPTFPNASATAGKFIRSDGTNWIASTPTLPTTAGTAGKVLLSDGTNYVESTPTYPNTTGIANKILRSDGTNNVYSTSTFADTYTASNLLYSNGANTVTGLATANSSVLVTTSTGVPSWQGPLTNGQLIIGSTGGTPTPTSLTADTGITIVDGSASITISSTGTTINTQTASYGLVLSDAGKIVEMNVAGANNLTVPLNATQAFAIGTIIDIVQLGAGKTTVVATGGVTIRSSGGLLSLNGQYAAATLYKRATDEWVLVGNIIA